MSELKKLTRLGSDTKKIAALLQAKAPKGHVLAYISPKEASLLKSRGGSGKPHAETGILSFENEFDMGPQQEAPALGEEFAQYEMPQSYVEPVDISAPAPAPVAAPEYTSGSAFMDRQLSSFPQIAEGAATPSQVVTPDIQRQFEQLGREPAAPKPPGGMSEDAMKRLGLAAAQGLLGQRMASRASAAGQAGKQEMQALAAPYQQQGQALQAQAQRGELTPAAQQSLQALRAQSAQAAERRGGVGTAQIQQQVEAFRQQLLQQQFDYGLKLSGIGDQIALGAIKTGMQADQFVNQLTSNYYNNIFRYLGGQQPAQQPQTAPPGV